ncbi:hypothetical protein Trydic_g10401 [Trypoxylus dichotomus]
MADVVDWNNTVTAAANFYVVDNATVFAIPTEIGSQVDVIYFPKCCPPEHVFEAEKRKCIYNSTISALYNDWGLNVSVVKSGLTNCEVIVDKQLSEFKLENFKSDRKLLFNNELFSYGEYCLDKLHEGNNYIARLCYSGEYCNKNPNNRKEWCLKKCCKDGYVLENKKNCILRPDLGLNIKDDLDVIERNDSFAIFTDSRLCRMYEARKVQTVSDLGLYCDVIGFTLYFAYIASFAWMNVLCFDIYRTVTSMKTTRIQSRSLIVKCMIYYSIYAISIPSIMTLFLYSVNQQILRLPEFLRPKFIKGKCLIAKRYAGNYGHIVHFVIPVGILIAINVIFFIETLRYYLRTKTEITQAAGTAIIGKNKKLRINRQRMLIVVRLCLVMGISWIFEIVSLAVDFKQNSVLEVIEGIIDTFNYIQGLFVFLIFLVKWETLDDALSCLKSCRRN